MKKAAARTALLLVGLFVLYVAGVFVRGYYGIRVLVDNKSESILRQVKLKVESNGPRYELGEIGVGVRKRVFIQPKTESHINLEFVDGHGGGHSEMVVGYAEGGYCGSASATVRPTGEVEVRENIDVALCKGSWLDFVR